ncbi:MAG: hypothetical protein V4757_05010 [Pseudomonadota bacterium]
MTSKALKEFLVPRRDRPLLEAAMSSGEVVADIAMRDELLSAVPVVGTVFKVLKAFDSVRDAFIERRLRLFVETIDEIPKSQRDRMRQRFEDDPEASHAASVLMLVLDKLNDLDKAPLLGFLLQCYAREEIDTATFKRLAVAVDLAFPDDLRDFVKGPHVSYSYPPGAPEPDFRARLLVAGLTRVSNGVTWNSDSGIIHPATELGEVFRKLTQIHAA